MGPGAGDWSIRSISVSPRLNTALMGEALIKFASESIRPSPPYNLLDIAGPIYNGFTILHMHSVAIYVDVLKNASDPGNTPKLLAAGSSRYKVVKV